MRAYEQYRQMQIQTAKPEQLLLMLYDGAITFLKKAKLAIQEKKIEEAHTSLIRAQDIVAELMSSLNMDVGEIAINLFRLYEYMYHRLVEANVNKDLKPIDEVIGLLQGLREAWEEAIKKLGEERRKEVAQTAKGGLNIAG